MHSAFCMYVLTAKRCSGRVWAIVGGGRGAVQFAASRAELHMGPPQPHTGRPGLLSQLPRQHNVRARHRLCVVHVFGALRECCCAVVFVRQALTSLCRMPNQVKYTMLVNMTTGEFDTTPLLQRAVDSAIMRQAVRSPWLLLTCCICCLCGSISGC